MVKTEAVTEALVSWCNKRGLNQGVKEFIQLLKHRNIAYILPALLRRLDDRCKLRKEQKELRLTAAENISPEQKEMLRQAFGQDEIINASEKIEPRLIAGLQAEQNGTQIEASFRSRLQELKNHLHT